MRREHISKCERCEKSVECKIMNDKLCHDSYVPSVKSTLNIQHLLINPLGKKTSLKESLSLQS